MTSTIAFDIIARDRASDKFDKIGDSASRSSGKLKKFAAVGAAAFAAGALAAGKFALDAIGSASEVEQSFGALESVYGKNARQVKKWAEGAADAVGLAKAEYANLSALVGSQLQRGRRQEVERPHQDGRRLGRHLRRLGQGGRRGSVVHPEG
jgi:hypothetical protein